MASEFRGIQAVFEQGSEELLAQWLKSQLSDGTARGLLKESELREQSREFIALMRASLRHGAPKDLGSTEWKPVREFLNSLSRARALQGFGPSETATFVFSLKQPLFEGLRVQLGGDPARLSEEQWNATRLLDQLGLTTFEAYQAGREEIIARQQRELLELSTPVVELWDDILALPLIGTLDSARTQIVMENLLQSIVDTGASIAIIDITGVPTVDTLVAQHLIKTVSAARLMGADCIISGIRPQIAQTVVHLGVNLSDIITKATLADAFRLALSRTGAKITRAV